MNVDKIRKDFPILQKKDPVTYFDNACNTLRPTQVMNAMNEYYEEFPACVGRSHHKLSRLATEATNNARKTIQKFIGAKKTEEIIFTRNATEGINLIANTLSFNPQSIVLSHSKEHNSNHVPWLRLQEDGVIKHETYDWSSDVFNLGKFEELMSSKVSLVTMGHTTNLDGTTIPAKEVVRIAHDYGAKVLFDSAQSVPHHEVNVKKLGVDFLAFSAHKMMGPSGIGALYINEKNFTELDTFLLGGDTVSETTQDSYSLEKPPKRYEAGLQDYAGMIGFGAAADYLKRIGLKNVEKQEQLLNKHITEALIGKVEMIGPRDSLLRGGIFNFNIGGVDSHTVAGLLDSAANIAVRSGVHCQHTWFNKKGLDGSVRASTYVYNTIDEAERFVKEINKLIKLKK
ncbi:aminotransferase class V-fold PLP-dependent enzyme [Candidatus Woesearchaeota archaeon]|nr:aminotransferase class V-fold PLP-dependent enzyme [Candidatus Woesearchaeota archaeon]